MFGKIEVVNGVILSISLIAAVTDFFWGKIYNWLTAPAVLCGILASGYFMGLEGVGLSVCGCCVGLGIYGGFFALKMMGGGDVKLLMALGALGGVYFTVHVATVSILIGGAMSFVFLLVSGKITSFLSRITLFLMSLLIKELEPHFPKIDQSSVMPFGVAIALGAFGVVLGVW